MPRALAKAKSSNRGTPCLADRTHSRSLNDPIPPRTTAGGTAMLLLRNHPETGVGVHPMYRIRVVRIKSAFICWCGQGCKAILVDHCKHHARSECSSGPGLIMSTFVVSYTNRALTSYWTLLNGSALRRVSNVTGNRTGTRSRQCRGQPLAA